MSFELDQIVVPLLDHGLDRLSAFFDVAEHFVELGHHDATGILNARLAPDMLPFFRQVHLASDFAKAAVSHLSGTAVPSMPDVEKTFPELRDRVARTKKVVAGARASDFIDAATRVIEFRLWGVSQRYTGLEYLTGYAIPSFQFHVSAAYMILRHEGVPIGKVDFLGLPKEAGWFHHAAD